MKEAKAFPKHFISAGKTSIIKNVDMHIPLLLDDANGWDVRMNLPGRREFLTVTRNTGMCPDIAAYSATKQNLIMINFTDP